MSSGSGVGSLTRTAPGWSRRSNTVRTRWVPTSTASGSPTRSAAPTSSSRHSPLKPPTRVKPDGRVSWFTPPKHHCTPTPPSPARISTRARPGSPVANETVRRLACDAIRRTVLEDARGVPLKLGRRTRTVPTYLFRLLKHRDRHCRAPGCRRTIGLHAHHLVHWADGGETNLENLVLLCSRHHHLVHEEHWQICGRPSQPEALLFRPPERQPMTPYQPPPLDAHVRNNSSSRPADARWRPDRGRSATRASSSPRGNCRGR